jgi:hypothetical protein
LTIPAGKKVRVKVDGQPIFNDNIELVLDEPIQLTLTSDFEDLVGSSVPQAFKALANVTQDLFNFSATGEFKQFGLQVWSKTAPLSFSFTTTLNMKTDAYTDVYQPSITLMKLPLPTDLGISGQGVGLVAPGPSILQAVFKNSTSRHKSISVFIGNMIFHPVVIKKVEPLISSDTDSNGYPIFMTLRIDVMGTFTATTNMLDDLDKPFKG